MDTVTLVGRLLISLAAVLLLMWLIGRRLRKGGRFKDGRLIDVLARQQLSRNSSLAVVRIGEQALVIGVTDTQVSVLGETDLVVAQAMVASGGPARPAAAPRPLRTAKSAAPAAHAAWSRRTATPLSSLVPFDESGDVTAEAEAEAAPPRRGPLTGSALSPQTWRQTIESLRDMTSRSA